MLFFNIYRAKAGRGGRIVRAQASCVVDREFSSQSSQVYDIQIDVGSFLAWHSALLG